MPSSGPSGAGSPAAGGGPDSQPPVVPDTEDRLGAGLGNAAATNAIGSAGALIGDDAQHAFTELQLLRARAVAAAEESKLSSYKAWEAMCEAERRALQLAKTSQVRAHASCMPKSTSCLFRLWRRTRIGMDYIATSKRWPPTFSATSTAAAPIHISYLLRHNNVAAQMLSAQVLSRHTV